VILRAKDGVRGELRNLDTGQIIPKPKWADLETGEYEAFRLDATGSVCRVNGKPVTYRGKARRLFFTPTANFAKHVSRPTAPVKREVRQRYQNLPVPLFSNYCEHYACGKVAAWMVSDEVPMPPEIGPDGKKYLRAQVVGVRYYCSWHFKPPRILDNKGEVVQELHEAGGVRPQ
jgi:hypothetical protein